MCGIVGYVGKQKTVPVLIHGLEALEYRGYDSSGITCLDQGASSLFLVKEAGKLENLKEKLSDNLGFQGAGIGHTRWATHGVPNQVNAHPHQDTQSELAIVHNGIIENYVQLKEELEKEGCVFKSDTDTEIAAQLWGFENQQCNDTEEAFKKAIRQMRGRFAFVGLSQSDPEKLFVFRRSNPIVIGVGEGENFVASDVTPLLKHTKKIIYLEDDEVAVLTPNEVRIIDLNTGEIIKRDPVEIEWSAEQAQKGGYTHFMLKEMFEQPEVIQETLNKRIIEDEICFDSITEEIQKRLKDLTRIYIVSCGTAYHAGLAAKYMLEEQARIPVEVNVSSEFRYSDPILEKNDLVILISQSGETADTLAAMQEAKERGAFTLGVVNVVGSTIAREADAVIYTHAGPEIGVASTKAYIAQLTTLALFSLYLGTLRKTLEENKLKKLMDEIYKLPKAVKKILDKQTESIKACAKALYKKPDFIYLGRRYDFPTALEGSLKFKEITYTHAHGYAAGEMKHGPIALVDDNLPIVCIAPDSKTYEKMLSNIEEVKARSGIIVSVVTEGDVEIKKRSQFSFEVPKTPELFSPILTVIPLQLLAYHVAVLNGRDVDKPRNLAKSVTVE